MPQLDFETFVSACTGASSDNKIACEPLPDGDGDSTENLEIIHPDWPPESFWLSGDAEFDWWDRNSVYDRSDSTKGNSISTNPNSNSNSQRFSKNLKKHKTALIGFPKPQKTTFADARCRRNHRLGNARLFPKRSASVRSDTGVIEPSSPKVSCIGRVRSRHDRNRRLRTRQRSISSTTTAAVVKQKSSRSQGKKTGFFESIRAIFRSDRKTKQAQKTDPPGGGSSMTKKRSQGRKLREGSTASRTDASFEESVYSGPPGLGSLNRFVSGRRSVSWGVGESEINSSQ